GRMDAELAGLVAGRDDDPAPAAPADDDRPADELGAAEELDGHEERIHVQVQHGRTGVIGAQSAQVASGSCQLLATHLPAPRSALSAAPNSPGALAACYRPPPA